MYEMVELIVIDNSLDFFSYCLHIGQ